MTVGNINILDDENENQPKMLMGLGNSGRSAGFLKKSSGLFNEYGQGVFEEVEIERSERPLSIGFGQYDEYGGMNAEIDEEMESSAPFNFDQEVRHRKLE